MRPFSFILLAFLISTLSSSCISALEEQDPCEGLDQPMPEASTTGADIMGCYINGEPWVAYKGESSLIPVGAGKIDLDYFNNFDGGSARVTAFRRVTDTNCSSTFDEVFSLQLINLLNNSDRLDGRSYFIDYEQGCRYNIDTLASNKVSLSKLDEENRIISFEFEGKFTSEECPDADTLYITEGRFDAKYL